MTRTEREEASALTARGPARHNCGAAGTRRANRDGPDIGKAPTAVAAAIHSITPRPKLLFILPKFEEKKIGKRISKSDRASFPRITRTMETLACCL
jgi:hypothetical protein